MSDTADLGRGAQRGSSRKKKSGSLLGRPDRFTLLLVAAAALGAGLVLLRLASYGPGLWWDGINYITIARNLLAGDGFVDLYHEPMVLWPPLYPAMLAGGGLFGIDPYSVAGPLNAVILGLTVLVAGWWLRRYLRSRILWLWGCFSVALALPLVNMASQALSESAFILFATLSLTQIDAHLKSGSRASLILAAAFSALACLTRYMGASLILAALPMLLAARVAPPEKMKRSAVYGLIAAAPLGLWMLRNFLLVGSTTGGRDRAFYSFSFIADEALQIATADWWLMGLTAPLLLALVIAACHAFLRRLDRKSDASSDVAWGPLCVLGGFALAYLTLLVVAMMSGGTWSGLQWRFLAPVYVPLLFAALLLMDGVLRYAGIVLRRRGVRAIAGRTLAVALMLALSLQVAWLVTLNGRELQAWNAGERQEYAAPRWRNSESVQYISEAALTGATLSNALAFTSFYAAGSARHYSLPCEPDRLRSALSNADGSGEVHVLYYFDGGRGSRCSPQQYDEIGRALSREPLLEPVAELADGKLYRLRQRESLESRPAMFHSSDAPVEDEPFAAFFNKSHGRRLPGEPWRWEKGGDANGWTRLPVQPPTYMYTPTVADVGHRLRAWVYYADSLGNRVKAMTRPSEPVQPDILKGLAPLGSEDGKGAAGASEADRSTPSKYDVYLRGNKLIYRNRSCIREDENDTRFPLIVYSLDAESGTPERATLDFEWHGNFWKNNGTCVAECQLPDEDLFGIQTGQVDRYGNLLWEMEHWFEEKRRWFDGYWSAATSGEPAARSTFDVYIGENTLTYAKQPCAPADTEAMFFLHGIPIDPEDLPDHRQQYGFDNLDFYFDQHGESFDGKCLAKVPLPEYGISGIRTGQYVRVDSGFDNVWEAEFRR